MIEPHVVELSLAIETMANQARSANELADALRRSYPDVPISMLRRAIFFAVTDPNRKDSAVTSRLFDAAFAMLEGTGLHAA